jgi:multiple sugar transport system permease protein
MSSASRKEARRIAVGLGFIAPNILGFLAFTLLPLVVSFVMAFTNWDIRLHNMFTDDAVRFAGLRNFVRLFGDADFYKFLGNTLFLMMGIPVGIGLSLGAALLLSKEFGRGGTLVRKYVVIATVAIAVVMVGGCGLLVLAGMAGTATIVLLAGVGGLCLVGGSVGGRTAYRTLFYFPHFTAGVATFLLWKKLYNPHTGPINTGLRPALAWFGGIVSALPPGLVRAGIWICAVLIAACLALGVRSLCRGWRDGQTGWLSLGLGSVLLFVPSFLAFAWAPRAGVTALVALSAVAGLGVIVYFAGWRREFSSAPDHGIGHAILTCGALMVAQMALLGFANVLQILPEASRAGLEPPEWLTQYHWAKPSIMIMGLWAAAGSNNMLLYLAGLSNIPQELYEAADIDGARGVQRFWHVTWPQLAPVTFFIFVMSIIHGLQGGFEMARTMTQGGPAGATTTLSYYIYREGFEYGRLGYASAVAWVLFALVFAVTLFNWKFGNRYVND